MRQAAFGPFIPAMVTPFDKERELDCTRAEELVERLISGGSDALLVNGTTGESPTVFYSQKIELFKAVLGANAGRVPVIANVGDNSTADSAAFARDVAKLGVDGVMCVVPYYNKPPQDGLYRHFRKIAASVDLPVILYNIPGRCVINMTSETTLKLAHEVENIVAIKEASGLLDQITNIIKDAPAGFCVYSGDDEATLPIMNLGGHGVISTAGNVIPALMKELVLNLAAGNNDAALRLHRRLLPLMRALFLTANPIMVKEAMKLSGFDCGGVRLPLVDATPSQSAELKAVMTAMELI
jgi:4-hydroxy-tetrahydrodipicolinate synthase